MFHSSTSAAILAIPCYRHTPFHQSCCLSVERWQKAHSFASFGLCVGFVRLANVCACALDYM